MQELQITMLGPSRVGKTTLLTAMYEQFESNIGATNLELTPDDDSKIILQEYLARLKSLAYTNRLQKVEIECGVPPSEDFKYFSFGLGKKGKKPSINLRFVDYPGGYIDSLGTKENREFVKRILATSHAILIAIDAPALMERKGAYHHLINKPQLIKDQIQEVYQDLTSPRLIIFAPVKCEKYLRDERSANELLEMVKKGYEQLINYLNNTENITPLIASVVTPVQTIGCIQFYKMEKNQNDIVISYFKKIKIDAEYNPKDSEQPLRYLLRFLLKLHIDNRQWQYFNFIRDWLKVDNHLRDAVEEFARGCKTDRGFAVLKGEKFI